MNVEEYENYIKLHGIVDVIFSSKEIDKLESTIKILKKKSR